MSRIGKKPIPVPGNVTITVNGANVKVKGPKGELMREVRPEVSLNVEDNTLFVERASEGNNAIYQMVEVINVSSGRNIATMAMSRVVTTCPLLSWSSTPKTDMGATGWITITP